MVPRISAFYGIVVFMYFGDYPPAHFHAIYGEHRARVRFDGTVLEGSLPLRARTLVRTWARLHREDLMGCWDRVTRHELPGTIEPLP